MQHIAFYDMDLTITRAPTLNAFLLRTARRRSAWRLALLPAVGVIGIGYAARLIDRGQLKQWSQRLLLGRSLRPGDVTASAGAFAEHIVAQGIKPQAVARIAADRAAGNRLVLATASYRFYAAAIAQQLGFDDVIATESEFDALGGLLPRIAGDNCYGPAKLRQIEAWMAARSIAREDAYVRFYSDHVSDALTLEWADEAFAVNPHAPLRLLATLRGWTVFDWR